MQGRRERVPPALLALLLAAGPCGGLLGRPGQDAPAAAPRIEKRLQLDGETNGGWDRLGGRIVFSTRRAVYAVDPESAAVAWRFEPAEPISLPAAVGDGMIAVLDDGGRMTGLDPDGRTLWTAALPGAAGSAPVLFEGRIAVALENGEILGLSAKSSLETWRLRLKKARPVAMTVASRRLAVAATDGRLRFFDRDGTPTGEIDLGGRPAGPIFFEGRRIFSGRADGVLVCAEASLRGIVWTVKLGGALAAAPLFEKTRMYAATSNGVLFALDRGSGDILWWRPLPSRSAFRPALWAGTVAAASRSPYLAVFDPRTGEPAGVFDVGAEVRADPRTDGGRLWLHGASEDGGGVLLCLTFPADAPKKTNQGGLP